MKKLTLLLGFLFAFSIYAQNDSVRTFILPKMRIYQKEKGDIMMYDFSNDLNKFSLTSNSLQLDTNRFKYKVRLNDIDQVSFRVGSHAWGAAAVTGAVGFVLGFFAGGYFTMHGTPKFTFSHAMVGGLVFSVPFALVGGLIGLLFPRYEYYNLEKIPEKRKHEFLKRIFTYYQGGW